MSTPGPSFGVLQPNLKSKLSHILDIAHSLKALSSHTVAYLKNLDSENRYSKNIMVKFEPTQAGQLMTEVRSNGHSLVVDSLKVAALFGA